MEERLCLECGEVFIFLKTPQDPCPSCGQRYSLIKIVDLPTFSAKSQDPRRTCAECIKI